MVTFFFIYLISLNKNPSQVRFLLKNFVNILYILITYFTKGCKLQFIKETYKWKWTQSVYTRLFFYLICLRIYLISVHVLVVPDMKRYGTNLSVYSVQSQTYQRFIKRNQIFVLKTGRAIQLKQKSVIRILYFKLYMTKTS